MLTFIKSLPKEILIAGAIVLAVVAIIFYQWGYINGEKKSKS